MAVRTRRTTKSKVGKRRATIRKKTVKRAVVKPTKKSAKKRTARARRGAVSERIQARRQKRGATPVTETTIIDVVDEPLPGVVRLTEIEEMEVTLPDTEKGE